MPGFTFKLDEEILIEARKEVCRNEAKNAPFKTEEQALPNDKESPAEGEHQDLSQQIDQAGDLAETEAALTRVREQKRQWEIAIEEHSQQYAGLHEQIAAAQNELQRIQEEQWQAEQKTTQLNERERAVAAQEEELKKREEELKKREKPLEFIKLPPPLSPGPKKQILGPAFTQKSK